MAKFVQDGNVINFKNATDGLISYGDVVMISTRIGVAACDINVGALGSLNLTGVYEMPCEAVAFDVGDVLYWAADKLTKTESGVRVGICVEPKLQAAIIAKVRL